MAFETLISWLAARRTLSLGLGWLCLLISFVIGGAFFTGYADGAAGSPAFKALFVGLALLLSIALTACFFTVAERRRTRRDEYHWD